MLYQNLLPILSAVSFTLAYPNILPKYQQEVIQQPGSENNDQIHFQSTIRDVLLANQIIPQVLDDFEPTYYIDISYTKHHERVLLGNDIPVKAASKRPVFTFHAISGPPSYDDPPNENNLTFTLILTDPDALSREHPVKSEMCHWILTNLTTPIGGEGTEWPEIDQYLDLEDTVDEHDDLEAKAPKKKPGEVEAYMPPAPPKKTGPHRYVFVLLEGDVSNLKAPKERPHWGYGKERHGVRDWSKENNLTVVGTNFFFAQHKKQ
ncbi:carboxypeptidase Y inhibitor [Neophaeococcomyces mojaviensis]|uniref:Carboxypeptidase Y inhibitor n=1 Tax=Neophaeococcomyces mojaviensis TaxID=3383035 RepID=A0ACC3AF63_9EURO|nr:carboxypeptidase Y inhibitor [Knufia sp. JES_112]